MEAIGSPRDDLGRRRSEAVIVDRSGSSARVAFKRRLPSRDHTGGAAFGSAGVANGRKLSSWAASTPRARRAFSKDQRHDV